MVPASAKGVFFLSNRCASGMYLSLFRASHRVNLRRSGIDQHVKLYRVALAMFAQTGCCKYTQARRLIAHYINHPSASSQ